MAGATLAVLTPFTSVKAADFNFSFSDGTNTLEGMILGLPDIGVGAATSVMITNYSGFTFALPQETVNTATSNTWTVSAGQITSVDYFSEGFDLSDDILQFFNDGTSITGFTGFVQDGLSLEILTADATFTPKAVPEPLTMLGAGTAIAFGANFKRKLAKNSKKK